MSSSIKRGGWGVWPLSPPRVSSSGVTLEGVCGNERMGPNPVPISHDVSTMVTRTPTLGAIGTGSSGLGGNSFRAHSWRLAAPGVDAPLCWASEPWGQVLGHLPACSLEPQSTWNNHGAGNAARAVPTGSLHRVGALAWRGPLE